MPTLSHLFQVRQPSAIRMAQISFLDRQAKGEQVEAINVSIGNVSLPMHPAMQARMFDLKAAGSPFAGGVNKYTATVGTEEANQAMLHIIEASGGDTTGLKSLITNGGSQAMELVVLGTCGDVDGVQRPLMMIDAAYTNYQEFAKRFGIETYSVTRNLSEDGVFSLPDMSELESLIEAKKPGALVVIPYDNPTGQYYTQAQLIELAKLCVKYDMWLISDEAYRELYYVDGAPTSVWRLSETDVPGISGRRLSIESTSKVWNACGLRIGALVTDNADFHRQAVAESTASLCASAIGQYLFGALAHESVADLQTWFAQQRAYYQNLMMELQAGFEQEVPEMIMSKPNAAIYSVLDLRQMVDENFDAKDFVTWCATQGKATVQGQDLTLLITPMAGFYTVAPGQPNPGRTQLRVSYVETPERMKLVPALLAGLLQQYLSK